MDIEQYQTLTGVNVSTSSQTRVSSQLDRARRQIETMIGYSIQDYDTNEYEEIGKTTGDCPCPSIDIDEDELEDPDEVVTAYRLFPYNWKDKFLSIDPCTEVHAVKLVNNGVTYKTLTTQDYRVNGARGLIKYLEQCERWCWCGHHCECVQLAVDADWLSEYPDDLLDVWADMTTYYSDLKRDIKSQTLGSHSYTRFNNTAPEELDKNIMILKRYVGPNGTLSRTITL